MPKTKTHSGASKRVKQTGSGLFKRKRTGMRHMLRNKKKKAKRALNVDSVIRREDDYKMRAMMRAKNPKRKNPVIWVVEAETEKAASNTAK